LASGECDAVVMQKLLAHQLIEEHNLSTLTISNTLNDFTRQFSFAVKKGDAHLLEQLEIGLTVVLDNGTQRRLENKWLSTTKDIALRKKTLIVGGDASYPPMEYIDEDGNPAGFNVELIKAVAREAGLDIRIELGLWSSVCHKLANGEIDIIQGMHYSHERDMLYDFSSPSAFLGQVVMCRKDTELPTDLDDLKGKNIVVQEEDINHQFLLRNGFKEELKTVASQEVALEMVSRKIADYALVSRFTATNLLKNKDWNLQAGREALFCSENSIAVQDGNHALLATLSEALQAIKVSGEYRQIHNKHLGVYDDKQQAMKRLYNRIYWIIGVGVVLFLIVLIWTTTLRREVSKRTLELRQANQEYESLNEELTQNNEELERAKEHAEESDKLKSAFLANMSHEIRTPMNGIVGFAEMLQKPNLTVEKQQRYRELIQSCGKQLLNIVNDVLDISKIETNQMTVRYDDVNLGKIIDNTVKLHKAAARKKGIELSVDTNVRDTLRTDSTKLTQIINNLLSNAVKYTNQGRIDIRSHQSNGQVQISVADTGIGIDEKLQPKIFDRFIQAETGYTRNHGGAGLGLSITKSFVELLGGSIWFESVPNKGTAFFVELPVH
jgi:signal transduction histidine kinase